MGGGGLIVVFMVPLTSMCHNFDFLPNPELGDAKPVGFSVTHSVIFFGTLILLREAF